MNFGLDFETYCEVSIKDVGLENYVSHSSFQVICAALVNPAGMTTSARTMYRLLPDNPERKHELEMLRINLKNATVAAHNSGFERRVLEWLGIWDVRLVDSAVSSRQAGGSSSLTKAAPQFLRDEKIEGNRLLKKFSMGPECPKWVDVLADSDYLLLEDYCKQDAALACTLARYEHPDRFTYLTDEMNRVGWYVDPEEVQLMQNRAAFNTQETLKQFRRDFDPDGKLNFNSHKQMKEWCEARGVRITSFAADSLEKNLKRFKKREQTKGLNIDQEAVLRMLQTKQILGGSSLSKLPVIQRLLGPDNRLRDQYMHCGAGQTRRTSGTGVQMQNLKRLGDLIDMYDLGDMSKHISNDELGKNLRQLFQAEHPEGQIIVGDFSSIEARGLAFLAGQDDKLRAFFQGLDVYKVMAAKQYGVDYDEVTPDQRRYGKLGELSCGYGAGPPAVQAFAEKMGIDISLPEATEVVTGWRATNPAIVQFWNDLDQGLHHVVENGRNAPQSTGLTKCVTFEAFPTIESISALLPGAVDVYVTVHSDLGETTRVFRGVHKYGRGLSYFKPSDNVNGPLWTSTYRDPKDGKLKKNNLYGGKLAGIMTQSFCRDIFFCALERLSRRIKVINNIKIIGQFHDEINLEWTPEKGGHTLQNAIDILKSAMSYSFVPGFPIAAEVHAAHRYIK